MKFPSIKTELKGSVFTFVDEILRHTEEDGKINIHINQVYTSKSKEEDYSRQSFIFYTLCKVNFFYPELVDRSILDSIQMYIYENYNSNQDLSDIDRKFIEVYMVRGLIFLKKDTSFFQKKLLESNVNLIYSTPILLHIFLATNVDSLNYLGERLIPSHYEWIAKESVFYSFKSEQIEKNKAFQYVDIFYYNNILNIDSKGEVLSLVNNKIDQELKRVELMYTSVLAKMFEGYTALYSSGEKSDRAAFFFSLCMQRKLVASPYLMETYEYTENSISEIESTAYVCLDTYAHLILGLLNLSKKYEK